MCRLALFNKKGMELIEKKFGLEKFLDRLEKEFGGHGNGIALSNGKGYLIQKGMKLTSKQIVNILHNTDFDWCIYHTRLASIGEKNNANCHPYRYKDNVLAMNGTESSFRVQSEVLGITDSEAVLRSIVALKMPLTTTLSKLSSVFVGFDRGLPYVVSNSIRDNLKITKDDNGAIVFASSLPKEFDIYEPIKNPFVWTNGIDLNKIIKREDIKKVYHIPSGGRARRRTEDSISDWNKEYMDRIWKEVRED